MQVLTKSADHLIVEHKIPIIFTIICLGGITLLWVAGYISLFSLNDFVAIIILGFFYVLMCFFIIVNLNYTLHIIVDKKEHKITIVENRVIKEFPLHDLKAIQTEYFHTISSHISEQKPSSDASKLLLLYSGHGTVTAMDSVHILFRPVRGLGYFRKIHEEAGKAIAAFIQVPFHKGKKEQNPSREPDPREI